MMTKSYSELCIFGSFEERFEYLKLGGQVGEATFGFDRYLNQELYRSDEWRYTRRQVILRDNGCDLAIPDREIYGKLVIHHINPVVVDDIKYRIEDVFDMENLITTTPGTHNAIHYGDASLLPAGPVERKRNDTRLW